MNELFSIGELARLQNISRQTLIFYDKIGLFRPAYTDPKNGYRYYSAKQLDQLDTVCIMKKIGFSLDEICEHMKSYTIENSIFALRKQLNAIDEQISELQMIKSRVEHRCSQLEKAIPIREAWDSVKIEAVNKQYILLGEVGAPNSLEQVSVATKACFARAFGEKLPIFFQSGAVVPYSKLLSGRYTEASHVFLPIEKSVGVDGVEELPEGRCVCTYHVGDYASIGVSYERLLKYCAENAIKPVSNSYELAISDYLSTGDENEYITRIMLYIE